jgi:dTDP-L-rhamnose 4-epimerase
VSETVLITGGAGFIGRHVATRLLERGYVVRVLDAMIEQVHRAGGRPHPILREVDMLIGDVRNRSLVDSALKGVDKVIHLAAEVGVGQSMYAIDRYVSVNDHGTAVLFQGLAERPVERVVVASSMSIYGEGLYRSQRGVLVEDAARSFQRSTGNRGWDPLDGDDMPLTAIPTPEWKRPNLASVYALTKYVQERLTLTVAPAYGMEGVALRLFNVYGPGQALANPYTGVLAIFASRLLNREPPMIFEDGSQRRDFVHVDDVADAFLLALEKPEAAGGVFNIGSGRDCSVYEAAQALARAMGRETVPVELVGKARVGDIRHCFADISLAQSRLLYAPARRMEDSLGDLAEWVMEQRAVDHVGDAHQELAKRGLVA